MTHTDNEIIKALECCFLWTCCTNCPLNKPDDSDCLERAGVEALALINRQKAEIERLEYTLLGVMHSVDKWLEGEELEQDEVNRAITMREKTLQIVEEKQAEIERLHSEVKEKTETIVFLKDQATGWSIDFCNLKAKLNTAKSEAIKEFAEKIDELLKRYAHLHKYAEIARKSTEDYADGTPMEMVSVWEVLSLKKWEMVEYETMNELQDNIETIAKERLLSELEKDFRLLVKEMTEGV